VSVGKLSSLGVVISGGVSRRCKYVIRVPPKETQSRYLDTSWHRAMHASEDYMLEDGRGRHQF